MDKDDIKVIIQKAKSSAGEGIRRAGGAAKKAAAGVNDGLDTAKERLKKAALAKGALHEIQICIKELEEENKVRTYESVYEETKDLIGKLRVLSREVKKDPDGCNNVINLFEDECRNRKRELLERDVTGQELQKVQVLSKRYEDAVMACIKASTALEEAKKKNRQWYIIRNDSAEELDKAQIAIDAATKLDIECAHVVSGAGDISAVGTYCNQEELQMLLEELDTDIKDVWIANSGEARLFEHNLIK